MKKVTLIITDDIKQTKNTDEFLYHLYNMKCEGEFIFKNAAHLVLKTLNLPHFSINCKRIFSQVNSFTVKCTIYGTLMYFQAIHTIYYNVCPLHNTTIIIK